MVGISVALFKFASSFLGVCRYYGIDREQFRPLAFKMGTDLPGRTHENQ